MTFPTWPDGIRRDHVPRPADGATRPRNSHSRIEAQRQSVARLVGAPPGYVGYRAPTADARPQSNSSTDAMKPCRWFRPATGPISPAAKNRPMTA